MRATPVRKYIWLCTLIGMCYIFEHEPCGSILKSLVKRRRNSLGLTKQVRSIAAESLWACHATVASEQERINKAAVNCVSSASLIFWACHARVASEQEAMERIAVDCQAGALENKLGDGTETSGGSHDVLVKVEGRRRELTLGKEISPLPRCSTAIVCAGCKASLGKKCGKYTHRKYNGTHADLVWIRQLRKKKLIYD